MLRIHSIDDRLEILELSTRRSRFFGYRTFIPLLDKLLLDTGFARAGSELMDALEGRGVDQIVNTHAHEDHTGNNAEIARRFRATVYAPRRAIDTISGKTWPRFPFHSRFVWGEPGRCSAIPLGDVHKTEKHELQVIPTPGHSDDHVVFLEPQRRWLFSGDLFLSVKVRMARPGEDAVALMASLRRILSLEPTRLFCYHRGPVADPIGQLEAKLAFMEKTAEDIHRLHEKGMSPRRIGRALFGQEPYAPYIASGGEFSYENLIRSFLRHSAVPGGAPVVESSPGTSV
jgi:glyoxylase-like metal-dependent hydrolase (beta-lactamase superfamily II)